MAVSPAVNYPIDCGLATTSEFARQFSKKTVANRAIDVIASSLDRPLEAPDSTVNETIGDALYQKNTFNSVVTDCLVNVVSVTPSTAVVTNIESQNTSILSNPTEENPNLLVYQNSGTCGILVTLSNNERTASSFQAQTKTPAPVYTFLEYAEDSLSDHVLNQVVGIANNSTSPPNHYPIYSTFDFTNNVYVKNSGFWGASLNFSGVTVNKSGSGGVTSVTAITPRHAIGAAHYPPAINDVMVFCDQNNTTVQRTVTDRRFSDGDTVVVKFNEDLPNSIKKYKFLPSSWSNYLPVDYPDITTSALTALGQTLKTKAFGVPFVMMSHYRWDEDWPLQRQNRYAYIVPSWVQYTATISVNGKANITQLFGNTFGENGTTFPNYDGQPSGIRGGDSGLPCFYIINGDLVFVTKHAGAGSGPFAADYLSNIESAISLLGSEGYSIQTVDLSGFTNFSS
jgi:hypothetical protein